MPTTTTAHVSEKLSEILKSYPDQSMQEAETLLKYCLQEMNFDSEKMLTALIIQALRTNLESGNLYLEHFEIPQIELFGKLIQEFPFVKFGHEVTNTALLSYLKDCQKAVIVDIGIGKGVQMANLIKRVEAETSVTELTILGIEPFGEALQDAEKLMLSFSNDKLKIRFEGICSGIEDVCMEDVLAITKPFGKSVFVNASLALHHIRKQEERMKAIENIYKLQPRAFLLTEPNVDHFNPDFYQRYRNCFNHFIHIFQVIDGLQMENQHKNALKLFFGREIEDIIGKENNLRFEKHELAATWIARLSKAGFKVSLPMLPDFEIGSDIQIKYTPEGYVGFVHGPETVLAMMCVES
jgi:hypothetical protein